MADIDRYGIALAERLLDEIDPALGGFGLPGSRGDDIAAYQLLWAHHMATGTPRFGDAVRRSLRAICRSSLVDNAGGGVYRICANDARRVPHLEKALSDNAQLLELLTWVWRVDRCPELRDCAERIASWTVTELRRPGFGFAAGVGAGGRDDEVAADWNGLMLVALIEAGSVFERREWLALAREVFDEIVATLAEAGVLWHSVLDRARGPAGRLDDYAMMSRAAIRLFEAFGKRRYLELAEAWVAMLDATHRNGADGRYLTDAIEVRTQTSPGRRVNLAPLSGNALMIGVLARLHALTGTPRHAARAKTLAEALHAVITQSGIAGAMAVANMQTAAHLLAIEISGDPKLAETRELMRIALDSGLPDRLVLGPGAGGTPGERPLARIRIGTRCLTPIGEAAQLRTILSPGGLSAVFAHRETGETVDSRSGRGVT